MAKQTAGGTKISVDKGAMNTSKPASNGAKSGNKSKKK